MTEDNPNHITGPTGPTDPDIAGLVAEAAALEAQSQAILNQFTAQGVAFDMSAFLHTRLAILVEGILGPHTGPDATYGRARYELDVQTHIAAMLERTAEQIRRAQLAQPIMPRQNGHAPGGLILPGRG